MRRWSRCSVGWGGAKVNPLRRSGGATPTRRRWGVLPSLTGLRSARPCPNGPAHVGNLIVVVARFGATGRRGGHRSWYARRDVSMDVEGASFPLERPEYALSGGS